jgi:hypothetical protein
VIALLLALSFAVTLSIGLLGGVTIAALGQAAKRRQLRVVVEALTVEQRVDAATRDTLQAMRQAARQAWNSR